MKGKAGPKIFGALALILAVLAIIFLSQPRLSAYLVEEALTVLLGVAVVHLVLLLTVIAFLLLWQGARFVSPRLKGMLGRITNVEDRPPALNSRRAIHSHTIER